MAVIPEGSAVERQEEEGEEAAGGKVGEQMTQQSGRRLSQQLGSSQPVQRTGPKRRSL